MSDVPVHPGAQPAGDREPVRLRPATRDEVSELAQLIREAFATVASRLDITPETWPTFAAFTPPERVTELMDHGYRYTFLEVGGEPAGCIAWQHVVPDPSLPRDAQPRAGLSPVEVPTVHLRHVAVRPGHRARGYGRTLVEHALAEARRLGARCVSLGIVGPDVPLQQWYERRGFTVTETRAYDGLPCPVTWMAMAL